MRTFDGRAVTEEDRKKLAEYIRTIEDPFGIPMSFVILGAKKHGLSSPVIKGEQIYITAKVPNVGHAAEAFGYSFEKMVLFAWSPDIGTTWIGGTMKRELFEKEAGVGEGEARMMIEIDRLM